MPAFRAASLRKTPSKTDATAKSRRDWFASRTRPALRRSSSAENSVRVMLTVIDPTPQANQALQGITAPQLCEQLNESAHPTVGMIDETVLLTDPRLILKPDFDGCAFGERLQRLIHASTEVFLNVSMAPSSCLG